MSDRPKIDDPPQTPGQWAVRWFALVAVAALLASVPLVHGVWSGLLGRDEAVIPTRSQVPAPSPTWQNLRSGDWMKQQEIALRELSPVVWWLRGNWNELRYRVGVPESRQVHFGPDGWLFTAPSVRPDYAAHARATPARRRFLAEVRDAVRAAGAELFVMVVPDKARIYPELAWPGGMPKAKADHYAAVLAELGELGIATVDLATPMANHRVQPVPGVPDGELYFRRDTHWRVPGALLAAATAAAAIEQRFGGRLTPRRVLVPTGETVVRAIGDLTSQLGFLTMFVPDPATGGQRSVALSLLADELAETRRYYGLAFATPDGFVHMDGHDPDAEILLIGTSFSEENGMNALSLSLGRPVRGVLSKGAQGLQSLPDALDELRRGSKAKVVVWELVERGMFFDDWLDPKL